ncbi:hypothetical protein ACIQU6_12725 [Streptomyces sp. NPDC090442]|uniref:hypothetical protein n=1 Tax=Streptomyces sp. NPDC090442 TaxID=3365962 RepID=UPI0038179CD3
MTFTFRPLPKVPQRVLSLAWAARSAESQTRLSTVSVPTPRAAAFEAVISSASATRWWTSGRP